MEVFEQLISILEILEEYSKCAKMIDQVIMNAPAE
jgi:hypothetical protein